MSILKSLKLKSQLINLNVIHKLYLAWEDGFERAVGEIIFGVVIAVVAKALFGSFAFFLNIASIIAIVMLFDVMPYWSVSYLLGWLLGLVWIGPYFMLGGSY